MKERPILFSAPMVRAILEGRKTQTRRAVKPVGNDDGFVILDYGNGGWPYRSDDGDSAMHTVKRDGKLYLNETPHDCPYGKRGGKLWVREAFRFLDSFDGDSPAMVGERCILAGYPKPWAPTHYEADGWRDNWMNVGATPGSVTPGKLRPGIHMPRWASRITLEVTGVRVEQLQDISEADAIAEGIGSVRVSESETRYIDYLMAGKIGEKEATCGSAVLSYATLWESINGAGSWAANPFVWVVEFKRVKQ